MISKKFLLILTILLLGAVCIAGCTTSSGTPAAPVTAAATTIQTASPTPTAEPTPVQKTTTQIPAVTTAVSTEKVILHETGMLTTKTYKTYDFKAMGYKFLYPKDKIKITIKSEKPIMGYATNSEQAGQLQALIPRYQSYSQKVDWGLIEPVMVMEKATDSTKEFTLDEVGSLSYVVDGRWMSFDSMYDNTPPFNYEITIVKTGGPTEQRFDFQNRTPQF